jgi:hypothetical protein
MYEQPADQHASGERIQDKEDVRIHGGLLRTARLDPDGFPSPCPEASRRRSIRIADPHDPACAAPVLATDVGREAHSLHSGGEVLGGVPAREGRTPRPGVVLRDSWSGSLGFGSLQFDWTRRRTRRRSRDCRRGGRDSGGSRGVPGRGGHGPAREVGEPEDEREKRWHEGRHGNPDTVGGARSRGSETRTRQSKHVSPLGRPTCFSSEGTVPEYRRSASVPQPVLLHFRARGYPAGAGSSRHHGGFIPLL